MVAWGGENHTERSGSGGGRLREREGRSGSPVQRKSGTSWRGRDRAPAPPVASPLLSFQAPDRSERQESSRLVNPGGAMEPALSGLSPGVG